MARMLGLNWSLWIIGLGAAMLISSSAPVMGADTEYRDFMVTVGGKRAGEYHMSVVRQDDGSLVQSGQADVKVKYLGGVYTYKYTYRGSEVWKNGKLVRLESTANDDGKQFQVSAVGDGNNLQVTVNGQGRSVRGDVWTTSCWCLPGAKERNGAVPMLDVDTGQELNGTMQYVGQANVNVGGQMMECAHYVVEGDRQLKLWFDSQERLVRQVSKEQGHEYVLHLVRLRK